MLKQLFGSKAKVVSDWYRAHNPMGYDLADVGDDSHNPLLGIMAILIEPCEDLTYKVCEADVILVGATIKVDVFQTKGKARLHLGVPEGVEINVKVHAQILRYIEKHVAEVYGAEWS